MKLNKLQHRVTRTRVKGSKLLEFGWLQRPLWIRRVLVRAQEGQLESAGPLTLVSNPADFRFVCCGRVPTREGECLQNTRSLVANLPNFDFRFWVGRIKYVESEPPEKPSFARRAYWRVRGWLPAVGEWQAKTIRSDWSDSPSVGRCALQKPIAI